MAAVPEGRADPLDLYLWPQGHGVRWWCEDHFDTLPIDAPGPLTDRDEIAGVIRGQSLRSLDAALAPGLAGLLRRALATRPVVRLHLDEGLSPAWQAFPFEWLQADGAPVRDRLGVVRRWRRGGNRPLETGLISVVIDLLDDGDPRDGQADLDQRQVNLLDGPKMATDELGRRDPTSWASLSVLAHGSLASGDKPFLVPGKTHWGLPVCYGLPPLVLLLACADDDGNLVAEASRLLTCGALTVIAPVGRLPLAAANRFLPAFLSRWHAGLRADDALREAAGVAAEAGTAVPLQLFGEGGLRLAIAGRVDDLEDEPLAGAANAHGAEALACLARRVTRDIALEGGDIDDAEKALCERLRIEAADEPANARLLYALADLEPGLPLAIRAWVAPFLARLAEAYDHRLMGRFEATRHELIACAAPMTPGILHAWQRLWYRQGRYKLALADTLRGIALLEEGARCVAGGPLIRNLINLLLAYDLPREAERVARYLDNCLADDLHEDSAWERFLLLDAQARIDLRAGDPRAALQRLREKRARAREMECDGNRELAGLHYVSAWLKPRSDDETAEWRQWAGDVRDAIERLSADDAGGQLGRGNSNDLYLLRACAAWAWRQQDTEALELLLRHREALVARIHQGSSGDVGPPGQTLAFLMLAQSDGLMVSAPLPAWEEVRTALASQRYFLELAALCSLMGRLDEAAEFLEQYASQRGLPTEPEPPVWLGAGGLADWRAAVSERATLEREVLVGSRAGDVQSLVSAGLLPM